MASDETESEIAHVKETFPGQVRVIRDLGEFKYVVNVYPEGLDLTLKFQIAEQYPKIHPNIIVKIGNKTEGGEDLASQLSVKAEKLLGTPMIEKLVDFAMEQIDVQGLDVQTRDKPVKKQKNKAKKKSGKFKKNEDEEEDDGPKKVSMKTAEDVINRIMWDEGVPTDAFTVGYMDRFTGMMEKNFSAFSWEDLASVDYTVLAIPKHRIHYFKYKDIKVWDKDVRMDNVFGSTGSSMTITETIEMYEAERKKTETENENGAADWSLHNDEDDNSDCSDDDSDDGIQVTIGPTERTSVNTTDEPQTMGEMLHESRKTGEQEFWTDKLRPNYFLAVRITDPEIVKQVEAVRNTILQYQPLYKDCCIPNSSLHITLCVIRLDTPENVANAVQILQKAKSELAKIAPTGKSLRLEGISNFYDRVVYAKVHHTPEFLQLVDHLKLCLWEGGVSNKDGYEFVPHMTIMKVSRPAARAIGTSKVRPGIFAEHQDLLFGTQSVNGIHLCAMGDERRDDGFYMTPTSIQFTVDEALVARETESTFSDEEETSIPEKGLNVKQLTLADKVRSNFFLTVKITNTIVIENVKRLQDQIRKNAPVLQDFCIPTHALHITFGTLLLNSNEEIEKAKKVLEEKASVLESIMSEDDPLKVEGLAVFFDRVVYAKVNHSAKFLDFLSTAVKCLSDVGITVRQKDNYVPHLTLLRASLQDARVRHLPKVTPEIYAGLSETKLGEQTVSGVHLCPVGRLS